MQVPKQDPITIEQILENLSHKFPEIVTRKKIYELTGGLISEKTLANLDSEGCGIKTRMRIGGKVCYSRDSVISFLKQRCEIF